ncbi:MAG: hypothetical protein PHU04_01755 [Candidatus Peribacteraceae bacterium]|nr:hypothetical protein [Candidatus Peribacteraceae bacterium]
MVALRDCVPVPPTPIPKKHEFCTVKGCGKATNGRQYCEKHLSVESRRKLSQAQQTSIRSACCNARCTSGKAHESGEQYCSKCKQPCYWKPA